MSSHLHLKMGYEGANPRFGGADEEMVVNTVNKNISLNKSSKQTIILKTLKY